MRTYRQYCPIARTSELLAERWTLIIVRNLLLGCATFTEIRAGAPGIPTAVLAQRLATLERYEVVQRRRKPEGRGWLYELTESGRELRAVCDAIGRWGARWLEIEPHHLDAGYVLWATARLVDPAKLPNGGMVVRIDVSDRPGDHYWLLLHRPQPELCTHSQGLVEDLVVTTDSACLVDIHLQRTSYQTAMREGRLSFTGPNQLATALMRSIRPSPFATVKPQPVPSGDPTADSMT